MRILITGAGGMLGIDVRRAVEAAGHEAIALSRAQLDIRDARAVAEAFAGAAPDAVVNCAAWTDVDGAEEQPDEALAVNGNGAGNLAAAAAASGAWTVHVSSDYVFDGSASRPYVESDPVGPLGAYARSKLAGELAVSREAADHATIVRTAWLFGVGGRCFPKTILRLAAERDHLDVVCDQVGCPTFTGHLARALVDLAAERIPGTLHVAGSGSCSWFDFARAIVERAGLECDVRRIPSERYPTPARRPAYSVLGTERDAPRLPEWTGGLSEFMEQLAPGVTP